MNIPTLVLLDLDHTLYDYDRSHALAIQVMEQYWINSGFSDFEMYYEASKGLVKQEIKIFASSHSRLLYSQKMLELSGQANRVDLALELESVYWSTFIHQTELFPDVIPFLTTLKHHEIPVVIVTDLTAQIQFQKLNGWGLIPWIYAVVTSEESGQEKPHPRIFELACAKGHYQTGPIWMIGDNIEKDMEGARQIQSLTFWKRNGRSHCLHPAITASFDDFSALIRWITERDGRGLIWNP